jgi:DoxX-like family
LDTLKIVYWSSTCLFAALFATTGTLYLLHASIMVQKFIDIGFPLYFMQIIGCAKILGAVALVVPGFPTLKEWAYAGFTFDFIGAIWSHLAVHFDSRAVPALVALSLLAISYVSYRRSRSRLTKEGSI